MLVVSNGAFKSGSTWLFQIIRFMTGFPPVPEAYLNPRWTLPDWRENPKGEVWGIDPKKLSGLLRDVDLLGASYLAKNHFRAPSQVSLLAGRPGVYVLDIARDVRDAVVSAYYHDERTHGFRGTFADYYWSLGRLRAAEILEHRRVWQDAGPNVHRTDYDRLKREYESELGAIASFLGVPLGSADVERIRSETSMARMRDRWGETGKESKFFRKGVSGDWKNHFDDRMLEDLRSIEDSGLPAGQARLSRLRSLCRIPPRLLLDRASQRLRRLLT